jgi:hypothetical protein
VIPTLYYQFTSNRAITMPGEASAAPAPQPEPLGK